MCGGAMSPIKTAKLKTARRTALPNHLGNNTTGVFSERGNKKKNYIKEDRKIFFFYGQQRPGIERTRFTSLMVSIQKPQGSAGRKIGPPPLFFLNSRHEPFAQQIPLLSRSFFIYLFFLCVGFPPGAYSRFGAVVLAK